MLIDARTRKGPFFHLSLKAGAWCFTHYNNMYHPRCIMSRDEGGMDVVVRRPIGQPRPPAEGL